MGTKTDQSAESLAEAVRSLGAVATIPKDDDETSVTKDQSNREFITLTSEFEVGAELLATESTRKLRRYRTLNRDRSEYRLTFRS